MRTHLRLVWTRPKPAEVRSQVEGLIDATFAMQRAAWRLWFELWGIR